MATPNSEQTSRTRNMYIYDLPYAPRQKLCEILDFGSATHGSGAAWEELGGVHMHYDVLTLKRLAKESRPTDALLEKWGLENHTVFELYLLLYKMRHFRAMEVLKPYVDPGYHYLLTDSTPMLAKLRNQGTGSKASPGPSSSSQFSNASTARLEPALQNLRGASSQSQVSVNPVVLTDAVVQMSLEEKTDPCNFNTSQNERSLPSKVCAFPSSPRPESVLMSAKTNVGVQNEAVSKSDNLQVPRPPSTDNGRTDASPQHSPRWNHSTDSVMPQIPELDQSELLEATRNWDRHLILGRGGFGTVYKGIWKHTEVAIKRIEKKGGEPAALFPASLSQSLGELKILNAYRHDNILPLYGYCFTGEHPCLVYQYMPNGSLEDRLLCRDRSAPLGWAARLNIARGTARGLQFLHTMDKPLIHGDIKSANILLDKNLEPKIGDFGLAREGPQTQYTSLKVSRVHGTRPYLPDEYLRGRKISPKVDTYSFGIVIFELCTGLRAYDDSRTYAYLRDFVESCETDVLHHIADPKAGPDTSGIFWELLELGKSCASTSAKDRPDMVFVLHRIEAMPQPSTTRISFPSPTLAAVPSGPTEARFMTPVIAEPSTVPMYPSYVSELKEVSGSNLPLFSELYAAPQSPQYSVRSLPSGELPAVLFQNPLPSVELAAALFQNSHPDTEDEVQEAAWDRAQPLKTALNYSQ